MKKNFISAAAFAAVLLSSCGTTTKSVDITGEWNVVSVEGKQVTGNPYIGFDTENGRLYGNAGCNRIMGGFEIDSVNPGHIGLTNVASTRMMCPDMETEQKVLEALNEVAGFKSGKVLISLEKREAPAVSVNDINGEWKISKVEGAAVEVADKTPFLSFNVAENAVHGNGGCNIINGPGMETERKVLAAMNKVASFVVNEDGTLSLMDAENNEVLLLVKNAGEALSE